MPFQTVPPSCVKNPNTSFPVPVKVGAAPFAHCTPENQLIVALPPFVNSRTKADTEPEAAVLDTVSVVVPEMVLVK